MRSHSGSAIRLGISILAAPLLSGCVSTSLGYQYLPERTHYDMFEKLHGARVRQVKHVEEILWGRHWFGFQTRRPDVRGVVDRALAGNPDYYVSNLNIHTDMHGTTFLTTIIGLWLPRVKIEFDVVEAVVDYDEPP
jgi:hypothetical protein